MNRFLRHLAVLQLAIVAAGGCAVATTQGRAGDARIAELQAALEAEVGANPSLPGELLHVHAPALGIDVSLAAGVRDRASQRPLDPHDLFRVASVTKTFTAAATLRLVEERQLALDDPIERHLPEEITGLLRSAGYATGAITLRHLLTHTSGIYDYATDERFAGAIMADPRRRWTRIDQVQAAMAWGKPRFPPGGGYHYSDTGYILLGEIIERTTGRSLAQSYRSLLDFERIGLDETYLESLEPAPRSARDLAHPYLGTADTRGFDPSFDLYGGGGLVSSVEDLARFYRALLRGQIYRDAGTLRTMMTVPATNERSPGGAYAMGLQKRTIAGQECWGHTGFWGTSAYHCPALDLTVVRNYSQAQPDETFVFAALYDRIADILGLGKQDPQDDARRRSAANEAALSAAYAAMAASSGRS